MPDKSLNFPSAEHVDSPTGSHAAQRGVKIFGLLAVLAARRVETGLEIFGVHEFRAALPGVKGKFAVILRQANGLETAGLVPDKSANVFEAPLFQTVQGQRQKSLRRPEENVTIVSGVLGRIRP